MVGVDIEQYQMDEPDKYLRGLLKDKDSMDISIVDAFRSYLAIAPSAPIKFNEFTKQVSDSEAYM